MPRQPTLTAARWSLITAAQRQQQRVLQVALLQTVQAMLPMTVAMAGTVIPVVVAVEEPQVSTEPARTVATVALAVLTAVAVAVGPTVDPARPANPQKPMAVMAVTEQTALVAVRTEIIQTEAMAPTVAAVAEEMDPLAVASMVVMADLIQRWKTGHPDLAEVVEEPELTLQPRPEMVEMAAAMAAEAVELPTAQAPAPTVRPVWELRV